MKNFGRVLLLLLVTVLGCGQSLVEFPQDATPKVTFTSPSDKATAVATSTKISAAFSKDMDTTTLTAATFTLMQGVTALAGTVTSDGPTATFAPTSKLAADTTFTATITTGAKDPLGDALASNYVWTFTTSPLPDVIPPTVAFTDPSRGATSVEIDASVQVAFDKAMDCATLTASTFTLSQGAAHVPGVVTCSGSTATFAPTNALAANTGFIATITTGAKDEVGTALAANYAWNFTTSALLAVTFTSPATNANGVHVNATVQAGFDEAMNCATLTASTFTLMQGATLIPGAVTCSGPTATFTPSSALAANTSFTATITTGVRDLAGDALGANYVWEFSTSSLLVVTFTSPATNASGVNINTAVQAGFDKALDCSTLSTSTFSLTQGATPVPGVVTCNGPTATFTPTGALAANAAFTATITTGVKGLAGDALGSNYVWGFTTGALLDVAAPTVVSTTPASSGASVAMNVAINAPITATFDEAMNAGTINGGTFTVTDGTTPIGGAVSYAGLTATFTPTVNLPTGSLLTATVKAGVTDLAGHPMAADYIWTFNTGTPPTVTSTSPKSDATGVAINVPVSATFSVPMNPLTITATTFSLEQGGVPIAGIVTYSNSTATFTPAANYPLNATLTAIINTGAQDTNGNALLQDYIWTFQTGASQVPQDAVNLGMDSTYAILAFNTVTNVNNPGTIVTGNLGISPGAALVGFPPGEVTGTIHAGDSTAAAAKAALLAAYNDAAGRLGAAVLPGDLSGLTFAPGLYKNSTSVMITAGNLTLDAQGDVNAVFIFQMGSTLTTSAGTQVLLINGASANNVYWAVGTSATLGTNSAFEGTVLAASAITMETGASIVGRLLAQGAAVALDTNAITVPGP